MEPYPKYKHYIGYLIRDKGSRDIQFLLKEIEIWSKQRKLNIEIKSDTKGIYLLFEQPDDATIFSIMFGTRRILDYPIPHKYSPPELWHSSFTSTNTTKKIRKII